jgi:transcriptional regulator with XRE-family HTH domain
LAQQSFGNRLAEARRRRGLSLEQVHVQLRISPAILESLEAADFYHMPLKGHARNMVSAYARFLGLDSADLTKQFLDEYHDFENRDARQHSSTVDLPGINSGRFDSYTPSTSRSKNPEGSQGVRSMWDKPIPSSDLNRGYDSRSSSSRRLATTASRRTANTDGNLPKNRYSGGAASKSLPARIFGSIFRSPIVLVIVLIIILALLLALWAVAANSCKKQDGIIPVNTGQTVLPEGSSTDDTTQAAAADAAAAGDSRYGPFELVVEPVEGTSPWVMISVDGEEVFTEALTEKKTWPVTVDCSVVTAQPGNTKVYRNDVEVELTIDTDAGSGSAHLTVEQEPADGQEATSDG